MSPDPGQVFAPQGDGESGQPQRPTEQNQEVAAAISHDESPLSQSAPLPQSSEPKLPEPQGDVAPGQPAVGQQPTAQPGYQPVQNQPYVLPPEPSSVQPPTPDPADQTQVPQASFQADPQNEQQSYVSADTSDYEQYDEEAISWTASEYIAHHKPASWFVLLGVATVAVTALVYFISDGDIISTVAIPLIAIVFGMYARRQPREQQFALSNQGVSIGARTYSFGELKSFSIIDEGPFASIVFLPMKRFMPLISIYYDPQDEDRIVEFLAAHLPMEQRGHDSIDRLMKKIRF